MKIATPLKTHGGKAPLTAWILSHFPPRYWRLPAYIEPFLGGGSVLLAKRKNPTEVGIDTHAPTMAVWRAIARRPEALRRRLVKISYSETVFTKHTGRVTTDGLGLNNAVHEFVARRMSRGGLCNAFAWSDRKRGGQPGDVNAWQNAIANLPVVAKRVKAVQFIYANALSHLENMLETGTATDTLLYCDPPYMGHTRSSPAAYAMEFTVKDHLRLLRILLRWPGPVILSGYRSKLYDTKLAAWKMHCRDVPNHSGQGKTKQRRLECLWTNY